MNYTDYIKTIKEEKLIELGIKDEFEKVFNSDLSDGEKKEKARALFLQAYTPVKKTFDNQKNPLNEDVSNDESEIEELVLKPAKIKGEKVSEIKNEKDGDEILKSLLSDPFYEVVDIKYSKLNFKPRRPFTTSTLQQAASSFLGFNPKYTMGLAQKLYEGLSIDGSQKALITYMRTDSVTLSKQSIEQIRNYLKGKFPKFIPSTPNFYKGKSKNAQEAHEAIRPVDINISPELLRGKIDPAMHKLYSLIWKNTVCSQMTDQVKEKKAFTLQNKENNSFNGSFLTVIEKGWRAIFDY